MPAKLDKGEDTVKIGLKLPSSLKAKALTMAMAAPHDGNVAKWLRALISREWEKRDLRARK